MSAIISRAIFVLLYFLHKSYRYEFHGEENLDKAKANGSGSYIFATWHQNVLAGITAQTGGKFIVIISRSFDADPVAYACTKLGHLCVRGSSRKGNVDKGGKVAKDAMIEHLKSGLPGAVTVDGPRGPAKVPKPGIIDMAHKAEIPIVPYAPIAEKYIEFNSWDKFRLPKPFSKIRVVYGEPIHVSKDLSDAELKRVTSEITQRLERGEEYTHTLEA